MAKRVSKMRVKVEGVDDLVKALKNADNEIKDELEKLISECAEIVFREADSVVPIGDTKRTRNSLGIEVGQTKQGEFYARVVVGARKGEKTETSAFYVTFYELGTYRQPARPFLRPALNKSRTRVRALLKTGLKTAIDKLGG